MTQFSYCNTLLTVLILCWSCTQATVSAQSLNTTQPTPSTTVPLHTASITPHTSSITPHTSSSAGPLHTTITDTTSWATHSVSTQAQLNGLRTALYYTTMAAPSSSSVATEQSSTAPVTTSTITPLSPILSPSIQPQQHTAVPSSQLPKQTPGLTKPHNTNSETVIFGLAGIIVSLGLIIILLVLALTLALTHNHKLKKLVTASKLSQTYEVPVIPNSGVVNGSSVSTPSNNSICKDPGFNQGYDRLLQSHNSRTSTPRRLALEYELPVISNIATNSHTALNVSTESINNARNYGHTNHGYFHKLHTARTTPQEYEVPVITNIAATSENGLTDSSESNDLAMSGAYDTVLLSPLPSGVYDYIPQSTDDVTMVIHCESESERLRHASTRTYEEVEIYNDIAQTEK